MRIRQGDVPAKLSFEEVATIPTGDSIDATQQRSVVSLRLIH
jgi:hypothetical protein